MRRLSKIFSATLLVAGLAAACTSEGQSSKADAPASKEPSSAKPSEPAKPAAPELPDGAELLAAHVEASGGADAIAKFESIHVQGTVEVESQKLHGTLELWWQKDGKVYLEQDIEGVGKSRVGFDGETIWQEDPITGLRKLDGEEAASTKQSSLLFLGHDWRDYFSAANTIAKQKLDDGEVWEIELVSKSGPNLTLGLDAETKLIRYMKTVQPSMLGDLPIEVRSDRYEDVEGYKFSMHRINALSSLLELEETITKFEVNVPVDPELFTFPSKAEVVPVDPTKQPAIDPPPAAPK